MEMRNYEKYEYVENDVRNDEWWEESKNAACGNDARNVH